MLQLNITHYVKRLLKSFTAIFIPRCVVGHRRPSQHLTKMQSEDNSNSDEQPGTV